MKKSKTSLLALEHMEQSGKRLTHAEIITDCLKSGFKGNYEEIAKRCSLSPLQVARRLSECQNIRKSGYCRPTLSEVAAEVYEYHDPKDISNVGELVQGALFAA